MQTQQSKYFEKASEKHFRWQTAHPYVSHKERKLLRNIEINDGMSQVLEVGCGEGANIFNLQQMGCKVQFTGIDYSKNKIEFAKQNISAANFIYGNALSLPFGDDSFDLVFCRDLLHHINKEDRVRTIMEMARVCRGSGKIVIIEGNGKKFTNLIFTLVVRDERGMRETSIMSLTDLVEKTKLLQLVKSSNAEPSNLFRVVYHHSINRNLYSNNTLNMVLGGIEKISKKLIRKNRWSYSIVIARCKQADREFHSGCKCGMTAAGCVPTPPSSPCYASSSRLARRLALRIFAFVRSSRSACKLQADQS